MEMKHLNMTFQIFKRLPNCNPCFVNEFDDINDARIFCELCQKTEDAKEPDPKRRWQFYRVEVI